MVHLFVYLLMKSNHEPAIWRGQKVEKGQLITGLNSLNFDTGISIQTLRTCLKRLEKSGEINTQTTNKYTIVTICNYASYQDSQQTKNTLSNKQLTNNQQTTNKQLTTNKNKENKENDNNEKEVRVINYPFASANFIHHWLMWKEYKKKEHRFNFKSEISEQSALNDLNKKSDGNEEFAIEIIKHSMSCGYKGLFLPNDKKTSNNSQPQQPKKQDNLTTLKNNYEGAIKLLFPNGEPDEPTFDITMPGEGNAPRLLIKGNNATGS